MAVTAGTRFGPYEVVALLGAGGMGEVFRARDTRLDRTVAIKILPEALARDPEFRERFDREARMIAQLDHPHICPLYDVGNEGGVAFLVMQYLEGETLTDRLKNGPLPLNQALANAIEIADALDKAHRVGTVHRDLKPSNIFLTKAGAKLLDFGLAKARANIVADTAPSMVPTRPLDLTAQGTILGTIQYMAPEQLEGKEADSRADIFAFGAVLYEMLTGQKAFEGGSRASIVASIMQGEPTPISTLRPLTPPLLDHVVSRCLAKHRDDRWQTASDLMQELKWIAHGPSESFQTGASTSVLSTLASWRRAAYAASLFAASLILVVTYLVIRAPSSVPDEAMRQLPIRVSVGPSDSVRFSSVQLALSPDGMNVAYIGLVGQQRQVWAYSLGSADSHLLADTDDATFPFWSPDGRYIGFFTNRGLVRLSSGGGPIQNLAPASMESSGTWNDEGVLLFAGRDEPGIYRVASSGGTPMPVTTLDSSRQELVHLHPRFLPGGKKFMYLARSRQPEYSGVYVRSLDVDDRKFLMQTLTHAEYVTPGFLLFVRESILLAQRFDLSRLELQGEPVPVAQDVNANVDNGGSAVSVSRDGSLLYHAEQIPAALRWLDRQGMVTATLGAHAMFREVELSPDSKEALLRIRPKETTLAGDVWTIDLSRGISSRLTLDARSLNVRWAPDGRHVFFDSARGVLNSGIYRKQSDGTGSEELVWKTEGKLADVSREGRLLIEEGGTCIVVDPSRQPATSKAIIDLGRQQNRSIESALSTGVSSCGRFSADARLIAYTLDVSGRPEVYVVPFPEGVRRIQISRDGGREPRWRKDGRELFYLSPDGALMAVTLTPAPMLQPSAPRELFRGGSWTSGPLPAYSVSSDGQRFLIVDPEGDRQTDHLTVIAHWSATLKR
jgi:serine/threonine protein kinase/Tol biopolymer transport system component